MIGNTIIISGIIKIIVGIHNRGNILFFESNLKVWKKPV